MNEIYGLVEVRNNQMLTFYFVTIEFDGDMILLKDRSDGKKPLNIQIPITETENFKTQTTYGTEEISFDFQNNNYKFVEYGNQTIRLFGKLLEEKMYLLTC